MISKLCSIDRGALIMFKRFLPSMLSHYNGYFELRRSFTMMSPSLPISSARNLWCFSWARYEIARECSRFMKSRFAFMPERLWADVRLHFHYEPRWASDTFFLNVFFSQTLGFIKDRLFASTSQWRLFPLFMWQLLTESVIQQKWGNKMIVTYNAFQLWTKYFPQCHNIKG